MPTLEKKPTYQDVAPLLYELGVKETFVDEEEPAPKPPKPPKPELTKEKAKKAIELLKDGGAYVKVAQEAKITTSDVAVIHAECKATWALKEEVALEGEI